MNESPLELTALSEQAPTEFVFFSGPKKTADIKQVYNPQDILVCPEKQFSCFNYIPSFRATLFKPLISPEVFLAGINNARIVTSRYVVVAEVNQIVGETIPRTPRIELLRGRAPRPGGALPRVVRHAERSAASPRFVHVHGTSALIAQANENYGHWHIDVLPSLSLLQELRIDAEVTLLTSELKSYRRRSLEILGVNFDRVREISKDALRKQHVFCDRLLFPSPMMVNYGHVPFWQPHVYGRILKFLWREHGRMHREFPKRIYINRSKDPRRRCLNENELTAKLEAIGFQIVEPATMTYDEQVLIFANADVIAGCMGAGLTNVVFAHRDAIVIELKPPHHRRTVLWKTYATLIGAHHHAINFDDSAAAEGDTWRIPNIDAVLGEIRQLI